MKLSVIIVNYNVRYFLEQAVRSALKALQHLDGELIVVDNASSDGSAAMMHDCFPEISYVYLEQNVGFSKANNIGISRAKGAFILLLNPDTVVSEDAFERSVAFMEQHPEAGGLGVHMIDGEGNFLPESKRGLPTPKAAFYKIFGLSSLFPKSPRFASYHLKYLDKEATHDVDVLSGAYMMLRKEALDKAGLLDETFFMYGEDIDLSYRIVQAGYRNYYLPESRIIHYKGESTKKGSVNYVFVFYRAMVIFAKKHFEKGQASLFGWSIELAIYLRAAMAILRRLFGAFWKMLLDALIVLGMFRWATTWYGAWADKQFDLPFIELEHIGFAVVSVITLMFANVYDGAFRIKRLLSGWMVALFVLLGVYALLPEAYRFSRAVLLIGSAGAFAGGLGWRMLLSLALPKHFEMDRGVQRRIAVVGNETSLQELGPFLSFHELQTEVLIGVHTNSMLHYPLGFVASANELKQAIDDFHITEVFFDTRAIDNKAMIALMESLAGDSVRFRMIVGDPIYVASSQEAFGSEDLVKHGLLLKLNMDAMRRNKRTFDLSLSALVILMSPILLLLVDQKIGFLRNLISVIFGSATWCGYDPRGKNASLPALKKAVSYDLQNVILPASASKQFIDENVRYLQHYSWYRDLMIVLRHIHALGSRPH